MRDASMDMCQAVLVPAACGRVAANGAAGNGVGS